MSSGLILHFLVPDETRLTDQVQESLIRIPDELHF